ncbi:MAG: DUF3347 domain-containing protein [Draconibacterium sp.]|nr:DUF3347 domain-containing protein [Draconibacterium sp.]
MKTTIIILFLAIVSWGAKAQHNHSNHSHSKMESKVSAKTTKSSLEVKHSKSVTAILENYLALKNALVSDNSKKAAGFAKSLNESFSKFDISSQPKSQQNELSEIIENANEQAEHISENSGNIEHQREHLEVLSADIKDLIAISGSDRNLYQTYCPMYNNGEGGMWLSESSEVNNPYYGSKMLKCGSVKQEITIQ